jgi:hypothetical protein
MRALVWRASISPTAAKKPGPGGSKARRFEDVRAALAKVTHGVGDATARRINASNGDPEPNA